MTIERDFTKLRQAVTVLYEVLDNLRWAVVEAQPDGQGHALADRMEGITLDLLSATIGARQALEPLPADTLVLREQLILCQRQFHYINSRFHDEMWGYEPVAALYELAAEQEESWASWSAGVRDALEPGPQKLYDVAEALFACWQSITAPSSPFTVELKALSQTSSRSQPPFSETSGGK
jgi:hypothetical protein